MKPSWPILVGTHLLALGLAWFVSRNLSDASARTPENDTSLQNQPRRSKAADRASRDPGDGPQLLAAFRADERLLLSPSKALYEDLKSSLPEADNLQAALEEALRAFYEPTDEDKKKDPDRLRVEMEVRALHWLRQDPDAAMAFLKTRPNASRLILNLNDRVIPDVIAAKGAMQSFQFSKSSPYFTDPLLRTALDEIKAGGGVDLLGKFRAEMARAYSEEAYRSFEIPPRSQPYQDGNNDFLFQAGGSIPFAEKDRLLALATGLDSKDRGRILAGFVRSDPQAAEWMTALIKNGQVDTSLANQMKGPLGNAVLKAPDMDIDDRIAARRLTDGNAGKSRQDLLDSLMRRDVAELLDNGRDWRYEFRHGNATAEEILETVNKGLPSAPPEGRQEIIAAVFNQLVEENPGRAQSLLDMLPEEKRRAIQFNNTWNNFGNVDPDTFLDSMSHLPEPVTDQEKDFRTKGWNWKARGFLTRYGDDYVEWVKQMPEGIDRNTAMGSLIWATREQNPERAKELERQLYPEKK